MKKLIVSSGGSAGHINPALNIAEKLASRNWEIHYIGNSGSMEEYLVSRTSYEFHKLDVQKIYRELTWKHVKFPYKLIKSILRSEKIIREVRPDAFLGCGGFVSGPPGYASHIKKVPVFLQEQNSYPGLTTRLLKSKAKMIFLGNAHARKHLKSANCIHLGNPISSKFSPVITKQDPYTIFLLGGSQGSAALNAVMLESYEKLLDNGYEIIWQTGKNHYQKIKSDIRRSDGLTIFDYATNIEEYFKRTNVVIARAGAITLAELETLHLPSILIPLPSSAENHQYYNALEQQEKGIATLVEQKDLTADILLKQVEFMRKNQDDFCKRFSDSIHVHAAEQIAEYIDNYIGGQKCSEK